MRHSDIKLTLDRYGHLFPGSEAAAVERIRFMFTQSVAIRKTGTTDAPGVQHLVQQSARGTMRNGADSCIESGEQEAISFIPRNQSENEKTQEKPGFLESTPARTRTLDPVIKSHLLYQLSYEGN